MRKRFRPIIPIAVALLLISGLAYAIEKKKGFAEGLFVKEKNLFFVSQMNTGSIYEYSYPNLEFLRNIKRYLCVN